MEPETAFKFDSPAIAFVLEGEASTNLDTKLESLTAYYIIPGQEVKITAESDRISIFFTSCDYN